MRVHQCFSYRYIVAVSFCLFVCLFVCWLFIDCIGGIMINVLASIAVYRVLELRSGQTKDCKIGKCYFPAKHTALRTKNKDSESE